MKKLLSAVTSFVMGISLMTSAFASSVSAAGSLKTVSQPNVSMDEAIDVAANRNAADADITFDFGNYTAKPGDKVKVSVILTTNGNQISSMGAVLKQDSPIKLTNIGKTSPVFEKTLVINQAEGSFNFATLVDGSTPMVVEDGGVVFTLGYEVPADCPDGVYEIGFAECDVLRDNSDYTYKSAKVNGFITVGDAQDTTTTSTTTTSTTTTTTTKSNPGTTTTTKPVADADIIFDFGNYTAKPGDKVKVSVILTANGNQISSMGAVLKQDSPIKLTNIGKTSPVFEKTLVINQAEGSFNFATLVDGSTPMVVEDGGVVFTLGYEVPADCPDGVYEIGFAECDVLRDNSDYTYKSAKVNGFITVGDAQDTTTTTTTSSTTTTTTTTTTKDPGTTTTTTGSTPVDGEYAPVWGDTDNNGTVNISDVVILNRWLHDNTSITISDQGKVNADCCDPQDPKGGKVKVSGVKLTAADSTAIIESIVHLVALPVSSK